MRAQDYKSTFFLDSCGYGEEGKNRGIKRGDD